MRREVERRAVDLRRVRPVLPEPDQVFDDASGLSDSLFGIKVAGWRGHGLYRWRVRWLVERDPLSGLVALDRLRRVQLVALETVMVEQAREDGVSWKEIGWALQITGEAARRKFAGVARCA
jgi:hypothetical protein